MALKIPPLPNADDNVLRLFPDDPEEDRRVFETWWYQYWDSLSRFIASIAIIIDDGLKVSINDILVPGAEESTPNFKGDHISSHMYRLLGDGTQDATTGILALLCPVAGAGTGEGIERILDTGIYLVDPGTILVPNPQSGIFRGQGSRFNSVLKTRDNASTDPVLTLGDGTFEPHSYLLESLSLDCDEGPGVGLFLNRTNLMDIRDIIVQAIGVNGIGILSQINPALFGEMIFDHIGVLGSDSGLPAGSVGLRLYATSNVTFISCNVENLETGMEFYGSTQCMLRMTGGRFERISNHALILKNCQPIIEQEMAVGDIWMGNDVVNGRLELTNNSGAWSNGGIVDNGFGNRILRTASQLVIPGDKASYSPGLDFQGDEWLSVAGLNSDPVFLFGVSAWSTHAGATVAKSPITMPGAPAGRSMLVYSAAGGGYAEQTFTATINTDYLLQIGILTRSTEQYRIIVANSGGTVWDSGAFGYSASVAEWQSFKVIRKSIPVTSDTQFTVRLYSVNALQTSIYSMVLISTSQIRMAVDSATTGTGFSTSGSGVTLAWIQETLTGKVYSFKTITPTVRGYFRAVVSMTAGAASIGVNGDGNDPSSGPIVGLLAGTDVEYIIPLSSMPSFATVVFYSLSGVSNILTIKEVGLYAADDSGAGLLNLGQGWVRNDPVAGIGHLSVDQAHLYVGSNYGGNIQSAPSAGNVFTRCIYGSNIYWNEVGGNWTITNNGAGDWAALLLLNSGDIAFAAETGLTLPTTRTNAQVLAAIKFKLTGALAEFLGKITLLSGSDQASINMYPGNPNSHVTDVLGSIVLDPTTPGLWLKSSGGFSNTGWTNLAAGAGVTSVAMTVPSFLSVSGSPITTSGTLAVTLATELANLVFAGPSSGGAAIPAFRSLVAADLPGAGGAWTSFTPSLITNVGGPVTVVASDCAWQAQVLNPKQVAIRYTVEFTVGTTAAAVFMSMPVTPKSSSAQYSQCFSMNYQDNGATPKACWNAIEPAFSRVDMFLFSGSFVSGSNHYVELNGVIEIA